LIAHISKVFSANDQEDISMFVTREDWPPSKQSATLIDKYVRELTPFFQNNPPIQEYLESHKDRISFDLDYAKKFLEPDSKILEIGAFPYLLTLPLIETGFDVTVVDKPSKEASPEVATHWNVRVVACDVEIDKLPFESNQFDCVILNEVFEHLRFNLIFTMREIRRVIRRGGLLLLSTPNLRSLQGLYHLLWNWEGFSSMGGIYHNYAALETIGVMGHVREYTSKEVADFLEQVGFEIDGVIYRGRYSDDWWLWRLSHYISQIRPELKLFFSIVGRKPLATE
jgi:SAM-dependent methyltransferase